MRPRKSTKMAHVYAQGAGALGANLSPDRKPGLHDGVGPGEFCGAVNCLTCQLQRPQS